MTGPDDTLRTYRLGGGRVVAWAVLLGAVALAAQALYSGSGASRFAAALGCLAAAAVAWVLGIRPRVVELPAWLEVRNPLRTIRVPWSSITKVDADDVIRVHAGDVVVRCFALPRRDRRPLVSGFASMFGGRLLPKTDTEPVRSGTTTFDVVEALEDRFRSLRGGNAPDGPPEVELDPQAVVVSLLAVAAALACVVLAVLG